MEYKYLKEHVLLLIKVIFFKNICVLLTRTQPRAFISDRVTRGSLAESNKSDILGITNTSQAVWVIDISHSVSVKTLQ